MLTDRQEDYNLIRYFFPDKEKITFNGAKFVPKEKTLPHFIFWEQHKRTIKKGP
jgi:hypothetical protein